MADFNKLKDTIRGAIYPNGRGAISADKHQAALLDMADTMQETAAQLTELSEEINAVNNELNGVNADLINATSPQYHEHYWAEDGTIRYNGGWDCEEINVSQFVGLKANWNLGWTYDRSVFCYVKYNDGTIAPLSNIITETASDYCVGTIPMNALSILASWAIEVNKIENPYFRVKKESYKDSVNAELQKKADKTDIDAIRGEVDNAIDELEGEIISLKANFEDIVIELLNPNSPQYSLQYWKADGNRGQNDEWNCSELGVSKYAGLSVRWNVGWESDRSVFCFVKYNNGTIGALADIAEEKGNDYCVGIIPSNAISFLVSWSIGVGKIDNPYVQVAQQSELNSIKEKLYAPLSGKSIFLLGDSISSTQYPWYKEYLEKYTDAIVYNEGASGRTAAQIASNWYWERVAAKNSFDYMICLVGGNDDGTKTTVGTFSADSKLAEMGEPVIEESDISKDYYEGADSVPSYNNSDFQQGGKFIGSVSHIIRKFRNEYYNFRAKALLKAHIVDTENNNSVVFPSQGTATEGECLAYAKQQGWVMAYGTRYAMMTTETIESKRDKLLSVPHPKLYFCTTLPCNVGDANEARSQKINQERKRLAVIECCERYGVNCIDLAREFAIDWAQEPFAPGMGYSFSNQSFTDNQGIYTMDGLHPNEFGYEWIARIVAKHIK